MTRDQNIILSTSDLTIGYKDKVISSEINLELSSSQMVCLLGQNGVGKSTLLKTISNLHTPLGGIVTLNGQNILDVERNQIARLIGIVTTERVGAPNLTVRELVSLGRFPYTDWLGRLSEEDHSVIESAISQCKINFLADRKLGTLSDGQRQKAMIARVLAQDTKVIILDEPTAHLDLINRAEVMKLLSEIKRSHNKSIIISTHELPLSMQFSDQLWLMNYNQPIEYGTPEELALSGALDNIFYHDSFEIDVPSGRVKMNPTSELSVRVEGGDLVKRWVKSALERNGIGINEDSGVIVKAIWENETLRWQLESSGDLSDGRKIDDLIETLNNLS